MSRYFDEVNQQPQSLRQTLISVQDELHVLAAWADKIRCKAITKVVFTGMGASYYASYPASIYLVGHGIQATVYDASELLYSFMPILDEQTLLVAISQSGHSIEILRLLEGVRGRVPIISISNTPTSPLAQQSDASFFLNAGKEHTVSTKTYTSTLAALILVAAGLANEPFEPLKEQIQNIAQQLGTFLAIWQEQMAEVGHSLADCHFFSFLGRGVSMASAMTGALIVKESAKLPTEGLNCAQFRHGPIEVVDHSMAAVIFTGSPETRELNLKLAGDITAYGGNVMLIGVEEQLAKDIQQFNFPATERWILPIVEIIPVQLLAAQLAKLRGYEVGVFRYIDKVTTEE